MRQIELGEGMVFMSPIHRDGRHGILFDPTGIAHVIGSKDPDWKPGEPLQVHEDSVIIWIDKLESARVLQDVVNIVCLNLNGMTVEDRS